MTPKYKRKAVLPAMTITETCAASDDGAIMVMIPSAEGRDTLSYFCRPLMADTESFSSEYAGFRYNLLPVVLDRAGVPWDISNIYILSLLQGKTSPNMTTYHGIADDLGAFKGFLDEKQIDFTEFPQMKLKRPTYRYQGYLKNQIFSGVISPGTAKRRMACVIRFYRWIMREGVFQLSNDPWQEHDYFLSFKDSTGFERTKIIKATDVSVKAPKNDDPFDGRIDDGGKLRPLSSVEQSWLKEALVHLGNTEMMLIHFFALLTGARVQTVSTLRVSHVNIKIPITTRDYLLKVGPRTGIDTKYDKPHTLHIPRELCLLLKTYSQSERAKHRRERAPGGDSEDQYLFLTQQGSPYYEAKSDTQVFDPDFKLHHRKRAQTIRQFMTDHVIPYIRKHHDPEFHYQFHDLRASYGMNLTDIQMQLVTKGKISLTQARQYVQKRMGHESSATTDRYLDFRATMKMVLAAVDGYETFVRDLIDAAMKGASNGPE